MVTVSLGVLNLAIGTHGPNAFSLSAVGIPAGTQQITLGYNTTPPAGASADVTFEQQDTNGVWTPAGRIFISAFEPGLYLTTMRVLSDSWRVTYVVAGHPINGEATVSY